MPARKIDRQALKYVVESIQASGKVINCTLLGQMSGVHKATIGRNLRSLGILPSSYRYEGSQDEEYRTHAEIAEQIKQVITGEDPQNPLSDPKIVEAVGLSCSRRMVGNIRAKYGIPNSRQRRLNFTTNPSRKIGP